MALSDEVISRYPETLLVQLTNPQVTGATTINNTTLDLASTDVAADFQTWIGIEYDNSNPQHVAIAVHGVIARLTRYTGSTNAGALWKLYIEQLKVLGKSGARGRILPVTDSVLVPTSEARPDGQPTRPDTDRPLFEDVLLNPPRPAGATDRDRDNTL